MWPHSNANAPSTLRDILVYKTFNILGIIVVLITDVSSPSGFINFI